MSGFNLLVGVALSAQPGDDCGNVAVWPRCHAQVHEAVRAVAAAKMAGHTTLGPTNEFENNWLGAPPKLDAAQMRQVRLMPGDVVLAHQRTPHRICRNWSPHVRYQCYFRLSAKAHNKHAAPLGGLHDAFEGLRGLAAAP